MLWNPGEGSAKLWEHHTDRGVPYRIKRRPTSAYNEGDLGSIPGLGRSSGEGNGNSLQYSCLENPMDAWRNVVGYSSWDRKELDTTEWLHFTYRANSFSHAEKQAHPNQKEECGRDTEMPKSRRPWGMGSLRLWLGNGVWLVKRHKMRLRGRLGSASSLWRNGCCIEGLETTWPGALRMLCKQCLSSLAFFPFSHQWRPLRVVSLSLHRLRKLLEMPPKFH